MDKKFLFVTPLTPKKLMTPLRQLLFEKYLNALNNQSYTNWEALLIGEEEKTEGNVIYKAIKADSKELKLIFAKEYILSLTTKPDYIIRIDDDDIINPHILSHVNNLDFDCYADKFHAFYDLTTGRISLQQRSWLANTVIHKYEHAMCEIGEDKIPLLQCDHSQDWIKYYVSKKLVFSGKNRPVYLRVLSPTTVTSGIHGLANNTEERYDKFKKSAQQLISVSDIDFVKYTSYLKGFGKWRHYLLKDFTKYQSDLEILWSNFSGNKLKTGLIKKIQQKWYSLTGTF